eukprot:TRINITY_DN1915_c0_g1_i1.p1 TRINITY_DN1915_c0_g1~~TRINITY_DN1915_c0_g1_i1.p1  ORF type:complete len:653 (-),score=152.91 TRINITY_DN1915_c0_g1_i1:147-2105(-)
MENQRTHSKRQNEDEEQEKDFEKIDIPFSCTLCPLSYDVLFQFEDGSDSFKGQLNLLMMVYSTPSNPITPRRPPEHALSNPITEDSSDLDPTDESYKRNIYLNISDNIQIQELNVTRSKKKLKVTSVETYRCPKSSQKYLFITTDEPFRDQEKINVHFQFQAFLRDDLLGLYQISLQSSAPSSTPSSQSTSLTSTFSSFGVSGPRFNFGINKVIATQFEPTFASSCFPCLDHPFYRAKLRLSVSIPTTSSTVVLSNMPLESNLPGGGNSPVWKFQETPKMACYVFGFCCLNTQSFQTVQKTLTHKTTPGSSWGCLDFSEEIHVTIFYGEALNKVKWSRVLETVSWGIEFLESWFDCPYILSKLDIILLPEMILAGMEGWGCIFLNSTVLTHSRSCSSTSSSSSTSSLPGSEDELLSTLLHELVHQWIGNLVGMPLWMKEGITLYLESKLLSLSPTTANSALSSFPFAKPSVTSGSSTSIPNPPATTSSTPSIDSTTGKGGPSKIEESKIGKKAKPVNPKNAKKSAKVAGSVSSQCTPTPTSHSSLSNSKKKGHTTTTSTTSSIGAPSSLIDDSRERRQQFNTELNTSLYESSFQFFHSFVQSFGEPHFRSRLQTLLSLYPFEFISQNQLLSHLYEGIDQTFVPVPLPSFLTA